MKPVARASSVWVEMPFMRGQVGAQRLREWLPAQRDIRSRTAARRERVLAHEWARARLKHILGLSEAWKWNGCIPPATRASDGKLDDNPVRAALIQLLREVESAEHPVAPAPEPVE